LNVNSSIYKDKNTIEEMLKSFKLLDIYDNLEEQIKIAVENKLSHRQFLENLLEIEKQGKKERRKNRNIKAAKFEKIVTLEEFDFSFQESINIAQIKELATLKFMDKKENVIFIGGIGIIMKNNGAYEAAISQIENNNQVVSQIGEIQGYGLMPTGSISIDNGYGQAELFIKVKGDRNSKEVFAKLYKEPENEWKVITLEVID